MLVCVQYICDVWLESLRIDVSYTFRVHQDKMVQMELMEKEDKQ